MKRVVTILIVIIWASIISACSPDSQQSSGGSQPGMDDTQKKKMEVTPPGVGMFFVEDDLTTSEVNLNKSVIMFDNLSDYTKFHKTTDRYPIGLLRSSDINVDNLRLFRMRPRTGVVLADGASPCTVAEVALGIKGIRPGNKVLAVNGKDINNCDEAIDAINSVIPLDTVEYTVQNGTMTNKYSFTFDSATFDIKRTIPISINWGSDYVIVVPQQELIPGLYCLGDAFWMNQTTQGYCFRVE